MKKRALTLALVLAMCLSLAIPAFADEPKSETTPETPAASDTADDKDTAAPETTEDTGDEDAEPAESTEPGDDDAEPAESTEPGDEDAEPTESTEPSDEEPEPAPEFTDVPEGIWYDAPVKWAVEQKITNGTSTTKFSPDEDCTQVQILTFLYRAAQAAENPDFAPAAADMDAAVEWAKEKGMIDDSFEAGNPCTRATAASYIWQAFDAPEAESTDQFTDVTEADIAAVSWALANGITNGDGSETVFSPDKVCNRAQIVTFLHRAYVEEARLPVAAG